MGIHNSPPPHPTTHPCSTHHALNEFDLHLFNTVTRCVNCELQSLGKELSGAVYVAKRFQLRRCNHEERRRTEAILIGTCKSSRLYLLWLDINILPQQIHSLCMVRLQSMWTA
jgi:hypothetical protein